MNDPTPRLPSTANECLAQRLAEQLGDPEGYYQFLSLAQEHPHEILIQLLEEVLAIPADKVKNRAAVFNWRLKKRYGHQRGKKPERQKA